MLSERLLNELNQQMNFEFHSAHVYLALAAYCAAEDLDGFANFFLVQAEEEKFHAMKFFHYINDRGARAVVTGMPDPRNDFSAILEVFKYAYQHEKIVTKKIYTLADLAQEERDHATQQFLNWFISEQVEEEATFDSIVTKLERIHTDNAALYIFDSELAKRTFAAND